MIMTIFFKTYRYKVKKAQNNFIYPASPIKAYLVSNFRETIPISHDRLTDFLSATMVISNTELIVEQLSLLGIDTPFTLYHT
jgi:hypothetical protein